MRMRHTHRHRFFSISVATAIATATTTVLAHSPEFHWQTVVNKNDPMPNSNPPPPDSPATFNSFNQPSVNANGLVVFRARSRGGQNMGPPTRGIYIRDMDNEESEIRTLAGGDTSIPEPNNILYPPDNQLTTFIEFPSIPRIGITSNGVATRGNHRPVWEYDLEDGSETRAGTSGIYVDLNANNFRRDLLTGASKLGAVPGFEFFSVPGLESFTPFEVFPGAPAITDDGIIAFKGNYSQDGVGKTGVFYRDVINVPLGGSAHVELIANSDTHIPNPGDCPDETTFDSTAPPSAAIDQSGINQMVFVGLDNEEEPTCGGIYQAPLEPEPLLTPVVDLDSEVPHEPDETFKRIGEGLSYDGRYIGFWGAWGSENMTVRLYCPEEGNRDRRDYCNNTGEFAQGAGDPNSVCDDETDNTDSCYQEKHVPVNQGIFVYDTKTGWTYRLARTIDDFDDFVFWVYSGRVPGTGESGEDEGGDDGEAARWRSSAFVAVSGRDDSVQAAFKARTGEIDPTDNTYMDPVDGIYLRKKPSKSSLLTVIETGMPGQTLDPEAPAGSIITQLGIERDGFRGRRLVINASMEEEGVEEEEDASMAGIYITRLPK